MSSIWRLLQLRQRLDLRLIAILKNQSGGSTHASCATPKSLVRFRMTEHESRIHVQTIAEQVGIRVIDIPRSENDRGKTPDFEFHTDDEISLVELKRRSGDWTFTEDEESLLNCGGIIDRQEELGPNNTISGRIREAKEQLAAYESSKHSYRLIWYYAHGTFHDLVAQRIKATLLGDITIFETDSERQWRAYFFDHNQFHRFQDTLDGAFVSELIGGEVSLQLILNPFSARYESFLQSKLVEAFSSGLLDPMREEQKGEAVIVGSEVDRSSERSKLDYLESRYQIRQPFVIRMGHFAAYTRR